MISQHLPNPRAQLCVDSQLLIRCPACKAFHRVVVGAVTGCDYNGDRFFPSLSKPIKMKLADHSTCEFLLNAGNMHYLADSTHGHENTVLPLPPL